MSYIKAVFCFLLTRFTWLMQGKQFVEHPNEQLFFQGFEKDMQKLKEV